MKKSLEMGLHIENKGIPRQTSTLEDAFINIGKEYSFINVVDEMKQAPVVLGLGLFFL